MKKTAVICAVILAVGLIFAGAGYALGGLRGLDKVSEKHGWIQGSPGEITVNDEKVDAFDAIEVTGDTDVLLATEEYCRDASCLDTYDLLDGDRSGLTGEDGAWKDKIGEYKVVAIRGEKIPEPEIMVRDGVLKINCRPRKSGISINFSSVSSQPVIVVCCPKKALKSVSIDIDTGDVILAGLHYRKASLETDTGDIVTKDVTGESQKISSDTGDIALTGDLTGTTTIKTDTGDVLFKSSVSLNDMNMQLKADTGDITVADDSGVISQTDSSPASFSRDGGKYDLTIKVDTGDISVTCAEKI